MTELLLGTDGSASAGRAAIVAATLASALNAGLTILSVIDASATSGLERFSRAEGATASDILESIALAALAKARKPADEMKIASITTRSEFGDPTEIILDMIGQLKPDIAVIGKRGRGRLEGLLLGSVSQKLVSLAPCSVIVVP